jgi:general secretion pathway protein G
MHRTKSRIVGGFTIVELLVVIVVIGILAAITIVSYGGVTSRAILASLSSDLNNASTQLRMFNVDNSNYPSTISTDRAASPDTTTNKCLKFSANTTYSYSVSPTNRNVFCLEATKNFTTTYNTTQEGQFLAGPCPVLSLDASNKLSYPGAGNNKWYDLSGNDHNGTINGATYSTTAGGLMGFDGVDDWITIPNELTGTVGSVCFFMKENGTNTWSDVFTIDTGVDGTSSRVENTGSSNYRWYTTLGGFTTGQILFTHSGSQWDYISLTFDGVTAKSYTNGVLSYQGPINGSFPVAANINIGRRNTSSNWKGSIASFAIYDQALSMSEIVQNFNALKGRYGI